MDNNSKANLRVMYYDYLGFEHTGVIVLTQGCDAPDIPDDDEDGVIEYLYIADDNEKFNDKVYRDANGVEFRYAEIRRSNECIQFYKKEDLR